MNADDADVLLDRFETLRHQCDLDLLVFFARHPSSLIPSEQLSAFMGYDISQLRRSLDALLEAGLVTRSGPRAQVARMYVFAAGGTPGDSLSALITLSSTRVGRLMLIQKIKERYPDDGARPGPVIVRPLADPVAAAGSAASRPGGA